MCNSSSWSLLICSAVLCAASALARPHLLGDATERADVRYNAACTAALAGRVDLAEQLLKMVAAAGALQAQELAADDDLAALRGLTWFHDIIQRP